MCLGIFWSVFWGVVLMFLLFFVCCFSLFGYCELPRRAKGVREAGEVLDLALAFLESLDGFGLKGLAARVCVYSWLIERFCKVFH